MLDSAVESVPISREIVSTLEIPKSASLTTDRSSETRMLRGLRSRWMTVWRCAASSPRQTPRNTVNASCSDRRRWRRTWSSEEPGTYSMTKKWVPSSLSLSMIWTMFGWLRSATALASRWKRSTRVSSSRNSSGKTLIATMRLREGCTAL